MQRRDAILVAVMVNAGLLVALISLAITQSDPEQGSTLGTHSELLAVLPPPAPEVSYPVPTLELAPPELSSAPLASTASTLPVSAPVETTALAEPHPSLVEYTVQKGDVLERIARRHGVSVAEIVKANQLKSSSKIVVGKVLKIPQKGSIASQGVQQLAQGSNAAAQAASESIALRHYTVQKGDNVWAIAARHHMRTEELLELNGLTADSARKLRPGDQLRVH